MGGGPLWGDVSSQADDVLHDDSLGTLHDSGRDRAHRTAGAGRDRPEGDLDVTPADRPVEPAPDLVDLHVEPSGDELDRCLPRGLDVAWPAQVGLEVERTPEPHAI